MPIIEKKFSSVNYTLEKEQINLAHVLAHFICQLESEQVETNLKLLPEWAVHLDKIRSFGLDIYNQNIDNKVYMSIEGNIIQETPDDLQKNALRQRIWHFGEIVRILQNYYYVSKKPTYKIFGKLFTRIWWIYFCSNMIKE